MPPIYYGSAPFALKRGSQALNLYYGSTLISGGGLLVTQFAGAQHGTIDIAQAQATVSNTNNAASFGNCLTVAGAGAVKIPSAAIRFHPAQNWSIRLRIRTTDAAGTKVILSSGSTRTGSACNWYLHTATGVLKMSMPGVNAGATFGTKNVADGAWHNVKIECTGCTSVTIYVDDVAYGTGTGQYPTVNDRDDAACIGGFNSNSATPSFFFNGSIANVAVFDNLSPGSSPTAPYVGNESGLRLLWDFNTDIKNSINCGYLAATAGTAPCRTLSAANAMSRSRHIAKASISGLQLVFPNWHSINTGSGSTATVSAAIEY